MSPTPTLWIVLLWIAFTATHLGLASVRVEPRLRARLGDTPFLGLYSLLSLATFVPLVWVYFAHRHAGVWLWYVPVGKALRVALYLGMTFGLVLVAGALLRPSPAAVVPGSAEVKGVYRITRHPLVLGLAIVWALHLIPNGSSADVAFFGGFLAFSLLGAWHQDARKLHAGGPEFRSFYEATSFLPFAGGNVLAALRGISPAYLALGIAAAVAARWVHGSFWPY